VDFVYDEWLLGYPVCANPKLQNDLPGFFCSLGIIGVKVIWATNQLEGARGVQRGFGASIASAIVDSACGY
jgi:hypothetical protein